MPFFLETDELADDPVFQVLAGGSVARFDSLVSAYVRLKAKSSHLKTNGYLTSGTALQYTHNRQQLIDLLCTPVLDRPPMVHRQGDECECLGDTWVEGYQYRIHRFLRRNPSKAEYDRNQAQKADLRDPRLRAAVYARDGGCCRYCRSGPLTSKANRARDRRKVLTFDHPDPDASAGPDGTNLVVACDRCNTYKGRRTPYEADMVLLPRPTDAERTAWEQRGLALLDRPPAPVGPPPEQSTINDGTRTEQTSGSDRTPDPDHQPPDDPPRDGDPDPSPTTRGAVHPQTGDHQREQGPSWSGNPLGQGRGGQRPDPRSRRPPGTDSRGQPVRSSADPDIYNHRSRLPEDDLPPHNWPPGTVPARPPGDLP
jgi:5-methylcytosine-specific restriction endonuclease McrA